MSELKNRASPHTLKKYRLCPQNTGRPHFCAKIADIGVKRFLLMKKDKNFIHLHK